MTIKQRREYFDDKKNWKVDEDCLAEMYGIRINFLSFAGHEIFEEEYNQLLYDFAAGKDKPKWCHGYYFILEDDAMKKVGITEIEKLMKEWEQSEVKDAK
jgi:hypothetical protein